MADLGRHLNKQKVQWKPNERAEGEEAITIHGSASQEEEEDDGKTLIDPTACCAALCVGV